MVFIIRHNGRIFVGNNPVVQESIISAFHTNAVGGHSHSGIPVTLRRIKQHFCWSGLTKSVTVPIQMDQVALTSRIYTSLGASPFKVLYGHKPNHFGLSTDDMLAPTDFSSWLHGRSLMQAVARQHLIRAQQLMETQADKSRSHRQFVVGDDQVYLKLQP